MEISYSLFSGAFNNISFSVISVIMDLIKQHIILALYIPMMFYNLKTFQKSEGPQTSCLRGSALIVIVNVAAALQRFISVSRTHYIYTPWPEEPESHSLGGILKAYRCCCQ